MGWSQIKETPPVVLEALDQTESCNSTSLNNFVLESASLAQSDYTNISPINRDTSVEFNTVDEDMIPSILVWNCEGNIENTRAVQKKILQTRHPHC